eukprot:TRINITY_DN41954_c0_g1_i1.p1 TRINITY_DN41954_c0_g1~~TRINITY_DN41954_c0_g1_i1.p1  ORF type:complete len:337 (+),score=33.53 TRINITY_DN41954_c0_g1_i1:44-1012(+)
MVADVIEDRWLLVDADFNAMFDCSLRDVLREARSSRALRRQVAELESKLDRQNQLLQAEIQDKQDVTASLVAALEQERKLRKSAEQELLFKSAISPDSVMPLRAAFFAPARVLDAVDLVRLGCSCSSLHMLAQEDVLWREICSTHVPALDTRHCLNHKAKVMSHKIRVRQTKLQTQHALHVKSLQETWSVKLADLNRQAIRWTVSRRSLNNTPKGQNISSPSCIVRGVTVRLLFYPKGQTGSSGSSFFIELPVCRGITMTARVYIENEPCKLIDHRFGKKASTNTWGLLELGPSYGNYSKALTIQVEFDKLYRDITGWLASF